MEITISNQLTVFLLCALYGAAAGLVFDFFRISRRVLPASPTAAMAEDLLYWLLACAVFFALVLNINSGEMRLYQFGGALIGALIYLLTVSRFVINTSVRIIYIIASVVAVVVRFAMIPALWIFKLLGKPLFIVFSVGRKNSFRARQSFSISLSSFCKFIKRI